MFGAKSARQLRRQQGRVLFRRLLLEDGMGSLRAWFWVRGLRVFGKSSVMPKDAMPELVTPG